MSVICLFCNRKRESGREVSGILRLGPQHHTKKDLAANVLIKKSDFLSRLGNTTFADTMHKNAIGKLHTKNLII
jgi:hypothetical protein